MEIIDKLRNIIDILFNEINQLKDFENNIKEKTVELGNIQLQKIGTDDITQLIIDEAQIISDLSVLKDTYDELSTTLTNKYNL